MYVPEYYKPSDDDVRELLARFGAAELITATPNGLRATMLPMFYDATQPVAVLRGHFARKNDHWQQGAIGEALAIINGADAYITPSWYETKREHGRVVPTWNYVTAHLYGELRIHDEPSWVEANVRELTAKYESGREHVWAVDDAPAEYISGQLPRSSGLSCGSPESTRSSSSQNRSQADIDGVIESLREEGRNEIAESMSSIESILRR